MTICLSAFSLIATVVTLQASYPISMKVLTSSRDLPLFQHVCDYRSMSFLFSLTFSAIVSFSDPAANTAPENKTYANKAVYQCSFHYKHLPQKSLFTNMFSRTAVCRTEKPSHSNNIRARTQAAKLSFNCIYTIYNIIKSNAIKLTYADC